MRRRAVVAVVSAIVVVAALFGMVAIWASPLAPEKTTERGAKGPPPSSQRSAFVPNADEWKFTSLTHDPETGLPWEYVNPADTAVLFLRDECLGAPLDQSAAAKTIRQYLTEHQEELNNPIRQQSPPVFLNCYEEAPGSLKLVVALAPLPIQLEIPGACADVLEAEPAAGADNLQFPVGCEPPAVSGSSPQMIQVPAAMSEVTQP